MLYNSSAFLPHPAELAACQGRHNDGDRVVRFAGNRLVKHKRHRLALAVRKCQQVQHAPESWAGRMGSLAAESEVVGMRSKWSH